ncbi:MAG: polar amino acid transport system substrate-binding protein [Oleiphilaceae bacterium]|jgi:polar amino acid transport system substrate-binding protein
MLRGLLPALFLSFFPILSLGQTFDIVGDDDYPPFTYYDKDSQLKGIDIELFKEVANRLDIQINIKLVPWKRLLKMTKEGDIVGSFALFKTPEREGFSLFTYPIHYSTFKLFTTKNHALSYTNIKDLYGKRIGIEAGFVINDEFDQASARGDITLIQVFSFDDAFRRLLKNGIDAFVGNDLVVHYKLKHKYTTAKNIPNIIALPKPLKQERGAYFVLSKEFPLNDKLLWKTRFTDTLKAMEEDGTRQRIFEKYKD